MKSTGRVIDIYVGRNGKPRLLMELEQEPGELPDTLMDIEVKPHKEKRSLDANGYYWALVSQIAKALRATGDPVTNEEVHRMMIRQYGCVEIGEDGAAKWIVLQEGEKPPEGIYLMPTKYSVKIPGKNGETVLGHVYIVMRGTHTYNTQEMTALLNGVVEDAKLLGIDTLTPAERERMLSQWKA